MIILRQNPGGIIALLSTFAPRPNDSLTSENWHKPYADALMEVEPQRLSRLIVEAERAIFVRYLELCMNPRPIEISRDLQNAVYVLIDRQKIDWKSRCHIRGIGLNSRVTLVINRTRGSMKRKTGSDVPRAFD